VQEGKILRKKSHLSLAGFLVRNMNNDILSRRWKAFYIGNVLPDCRPAFLMVRHEYDETFSLVEEKIRRLVEDKEHLPEDSTRYMMDLGQVLHYIADYFTFPHNVNYVGGFRDHCKYEKYLKLRLRSYIREGDAVFHKESSVNFSSANDILRYIEKCHNAYLQNLSTVEEDCEYITRVCSEVLAAILYLAGQSSVAYAA